ncbi:hypothetical protein SAMN04488012_10760 [Palleronia salina]|uniref:Uncharacterized protein n=1 Tax=Palleronia salina TaxID=313368 RepID=A0A1M6I7W4_9RHOB|nr:hypothetical protein [Palleronia salina]SHJ30485.1 hypothetical protein SAMN04488012_10760 [Palleronia salina]
MGRFTCFLFASVVCATPALAEDLCRAEVNSTTLTIDRDALDAPRPGLRERAAGWAALGLDRVRGRPPACDSETLIAFLAREVPEDDLSGYCLLPDDLLGFLLVPGERTYRGRCARTACERVNTARDTAVGIAGTATDIATGRAEGQSRTNAVLHASGAAILSGSAASIASSVGTGASGAVSAALAAPALAGAAAVSLVAVGGAVYLCSADDAEAGAEGTATPDAARQPVD